MSAIRLYIDEDCLDQAFVAALRARSIDVTTALEQGMAGRSDVEQLRRAAQLQRVLYSSNVRDFFSLHTTFATQGEPHAGIILVQRQRLSIGTQLRGVLQLVAAKSAEEMMSNVEFLSAWLTGTD